MNATWSKPADGIWGQPRALVDILAVPAAGERLDDPRRLAAVPIERIVKAGARRVVPKPLAGPGMIRELAAEIVGERPSCQAGEEIPRQSAEPIAAGEAPDRPLDVVRLRPKQGHQGRPYGRRQALDRSQLGHLTEIGASPSLPGVTVDRSRIRGSHIHEAGLVRNLKAKASQILGERGTARRQRDLGQEPEGV